MQSSTSKNVRACLPWGLALVQIDPGLYFAFQCAKTSSRFLFMHFCNHACSEVLQFVWKLILRGKQRSLGPNNQESSHDPWFLFENMDSTRTLRWNPAGCISRCMLRNKLAQRHYRERSITAFCVGRGERSIPFHYKFRRMIHHGLGPSWFLLGVTQWSGLLFSKIDSWSHDSSSWHVFGVGEVLQSPFQDCVPVACSAAMECKEAAMLGAQRLE